MELNQKENFMNTQSLKLVYFSPTGTTRTIARAVARGMNSGNVEQVDITLPDARRRPLQTSEHDLLIVGVPVYMGRVPALATEWLCTIKARNTPAVGIVVYGNRAYENALLELSDIMRSRGCIPIAGAAYIGEHSFSTPEIPTAHGRPDASDLDHAESFGRKIFAKLDVVSSVDDIADIDISGDTPYGGITKLWDVDFIAVGDECTQCGICTDECPVGAIDPDDSHVIDVVKCITCCACIKGCPQNARTIKAGLVKDAQLRLHTLHNEHKEPEIFI